MILVASSWILNTLYLKTQIKVYKAHGNVHRLIIPTFKGRHLAFRGLSNTARSAALFNETVSPKWILSMATDMHVHCCAAHLALMYANPSASVSPTTDNIKSEHCSKLHEIRRLLGNVIHIKVHKNI